MKKSNKSILLTLLFAVLLNVTVFTPPVFATENLPTVWVKVYTIQTVDTGSIPLWIIGVLAIAIAAVAFIGLIWWNKRQKSFTEMFTGSEDPVNGVP